MAAAGPALVVAIAIKIPLLLPNVLLSGSEGGSFRHDALGATTAAFTPVRGAFHDSLEEEPRGVRSMAVQE
jgi:hypothetical protein